MLDVVLTIAQFVQHFEVAAYGIEERLMLVVRNVVFLRRCLDDGSNVPIMNVAYMREQMVLHLVVKPAYEPREKAAAVGEVGGRRQLVDGPIVLHAAIFIGMVERSLFDDVGGLEDERQDQTTNEMHDQEPDEELPPNDASKQQGEYHRQTYVPRLIEDNFRQCLAIGFTLALEQVLFAIAHQLLEILANEPVNRHQRIQERCVENLEAVHGLALRVRRKTEDGLVDILIVVVDVGERMVQYVVLYAPVDVVSTNEINQVAHRLIDALVG